MNVSFVRRTFVLIAALGALAILPQGASAATQWVAQPPETVGANTSCDDPGFLSISDAVAAAVNGDTVHVCSGVWGIDDSIYFFKELTIEGDGADETILDSNFTSGPVIYNDSDYPLTVTDLRIADARSESPSAIYAPDGPLLVEDVLIENSGSLGQSLVYAAEETTIRRSSFVGTEGTYARPFVYAEDNVTVEDSTFSSNGVDGLAAGIVIPSTAIQKDLTVSGSTFTGLSAFCVSAIFNGADDLGTDTTIINSTFTGNTVSGGECGAAHIWSDGTLGLYNSTVSGNTTGDANDLIGLDGMTIANSIIDGDPELGRGTSCEFDFSTPTNLGGNVISDQTLGCDDFVGGPAPSLATKVPLASVALEPLADNGGPTETMALGEGSVAIGAAVAAECPEFDQRGEPRPLDDCDSGAFQRSAAPVPVGPALKASVGTAKKVRAGKTAKVGLRVTNRATSQSAAESLRSCLTLPRTLLFVSAGKGKVNGRTACWNRSSLAIGSSVTFKARVRALKSAASTRASATLRGTATASGQSGGSASASGRTAIRILPARVPRPQPPTG